MGLIIVSISTSLIILTQIILSKLLSNKYSSKWKYYIWLVLCIRLLIPFNFNFETAPIKVEKIPSTSVFTKPESSESVPDIELNDDENVKENIGTDEKVNHNEKENTKQHIKLNDIILYVWFVGAVLFLSYHIVSYNVFQKTIRKDCEKLYINCRLPVYSCSKINSPMLIGFFKPRILICEKDYSKQELEFILKHELTHYRRKDLWYKFLLLVVNAVHFFNPIIYLMVRQSNVDLELTCDNLVVKNMDSEYKKTYALTILKNINGGKKL